jgi:hypothetical protein
MLGFLFWDLCGTQRTNLVSPLYASAPPLPFTSAHDLCGKDVRPRTVVESIRRNAKLTPYVLSTPTPAARLHLSAVENGIDKGENWTKL